MKSNAVTSIAEKAARAVAREPVAACIVRSWDENPSALDLLVVVADPTEKVARESVSLRGRKVSVTVVSKLLFEKDVQRGGLGEFVAELLLEPYVPLVGGDYLESQETDLKIRIIQEELENLDLRFHDLMPELRIDPRFFYHARMQRRAKINPLVRSAYIRSLSAGTSDLRGFDRALQSLAVSGFLHFNEHVKVTPKLLSQLPKPSQRAVMPFREIGLAIRRLAAYGMADDFPGVSLLQDITRRFDPGFNEDLNLPDPKSFLFLGTESGLVAMSDRRDYEELISSGISSTGPTQVKRIGGALNFVYLIEFQQGERRRKVVAKTYQDWYGLKWIPLSIWAIGSQNFDILGGKRLANEYRMNRLLRSKGRNAPQILHLSMPRRTIIEDFVSGKGFDRVARECLTSPSSNLLRAISSLGKEISYIHEAGVTLGDSKPDNAILDNKGRIWFVDLEQASQGGNPAWDLAEFLYYTGHYTLRWSRMKTLCEAFLGGYLEAGDRRYVEEISRIGYKRIFGIVTAPHIIMGISKLCRSYASSSS